MTDFNTSVQFSATYGGDDRPVKNTDVTDMPAGTAVILDGTNVISGTQPVAGVLLPVASGGAQGGGWGITMYDIPVGKIGVVRKLGSQVAIADGTIAAGARVRASDTSGKVGRVKACATGEAQMGRSNNACVDGDTCLVNFEFANNA